jgi:hypothetical protein
MDAPRVLPVDGIVQVLPGDRRSRLGQRQRQVAQLPRQLHRSRLGLAVFKGADYRPSAFARIHTPLVSAGQQHNDVPSHPCRSLRIPARVFPKCSTSRSRLSPARPAPHLRLPGWLPEGTGRFADGNQPDITCSGGQISHHGRLPRRTVAPGARPQSPRTGSSAPGTGPNLPRRSLLTRGDLTFEPEPPRSQTLAFRGL